MFFCRQSTDDPGPTSCRNPARRTSPPPSSAPLSLSATTAPRAAARSPPPATRSRPGRAGSAGARRARRRRAGARSSVMPKTHPRRSNVSANTFGRVRRRRARRSPPRASGRSRRSRLSTGTSGAVERCRRCRWGTTWAPQESPRRIPFSESESRRVVHARRPRWPIAIWPLPPSYPGNRARATDSPAMADPHRRASVPPAARRTQTHPTVGQATGTRRSDDRSARPRSLYFPSMKQSPRDPRPAHCSPHGPAPWS